MRRVFVLLLVVLLCASAPFTSSLKMNYMVYWEIWIYRIVGSFGMSIAGFRHVDSWGTVGTVVKIACAHLSQQKFVHNMRHLLPLPEHCYIHRIIVRVNCEATGFRNDASWIARTAMEVIFNFKNLCIQMFKQSGNKTANCLARSFVFQPGCMISWGVVSTESLSCY